MKITPPIKLLCWTAGLLAGIGCATPTARIPLGMWSGQGVFAAVGDSEEQHDERILIHGEYPTTLKITKLPSGPEGALQVEIVSLRGEQPQMDGDRTAIVLHLTPAEASPDGQTALYRIERLGLSFDENPPKPDEPPEGPTFATCAVWDDELVVRLQYMLNFCDVLRFKQGRLQKEGWYRDEQERSLFHWVETLKPID